LRVANWEVLTDRTPLGYELFPCALASFVSQLTSHTHGGDGLAYRYR
jgi:hypothetical protein